MRRSSRALVGGALAALIVVALSACQAPVAEQSAPTPTATPVIPYGDGVLRIGGLVPTTGAASVLSAAQVAGIELAVREIDEAGGVRGAPVQVFHRDVGDPGTGVLAASFAELVAKGVDVVVGPSDAALATELIPLATAARIPVISQDASSAAVGALDAGGYLFRLGVGPEVLAASANDIIGESSAAVLGVDDGFGGAVVDAIDAARAASDAAPVSGALVPAVAGPVPATVTKALKNDPDLVLVASSVASAEATTALVQSLLDDGVEASQLLVVTDGMIDFSASPIAGAVAGGRAIASATSIDDAFRARVLSSDPSVTDFGYAAESYDAVMLAALAVTVAGDDGGESIARSLPLVTRPSVACMSFAECIEILRTEPAIDYQGMTGGRDLTDAGDTAPGSLSLWRFGPEGRAERVGSAASAPQL